MALNVIKLALLPHRLFKFLWRRFLARPVERDGRQPLQGKPRALSNRERGEKRTHPHGEGDGNASGLKRPLRLGSMLGAQAARLGSTGRRHGRG
ncbi:hypothetical protein EYF80_054112 [Liparis tanakae]|uniref:Uncharacterized protein n=1 Tax=Liparis tanakae TaxID=230148 RepID=A0A4Z2F4P2_9TELE|nr:hypothetical protein EYF80_054112 [Liparis tanakae]